MFSRRGRGGPSRSTPANVQCQKCLKRERHYSYECKASTQERPYVSRPSRSQQLRNPKLVPKLTNDSLTPQETKKGVADGVLAKAEAERARKREREEREDELVEAVSKRRRSASSHSVSTISTASRSRSRSINRAQSPPPLQRGRSPDFEKSRRQSVGRESYSHSRSRSRSESRSPSRSPSRSRSGSRGRSPVRATQGRRSLSKDSDSDRRISERHYQDDGPGPAGDAVPPRHSRRYSSDSRGSIDSPPPPRRGYASRSPEPNERRGREPEQRRPRRGRGGHHGDRGHGDRHRAPQAAPRNDRERSLSPFSQRKAMTRAMNEGRE